MITKKLWQENSYLKECVSPIAEIRENTILLEQTVFYAKSGGQEGDRGYFELASGEKIPVLDTTFNENKAILHHLETVPATLKKGVSLKAVIDWDLRYKRLQMHSAMHLMCSLIKNVTWRFFCIIFSRFCNLELNFQKAILFFLPECFKSAFSQRDKATS